MYYRRKILLSLIQKFTGQLDKIRLKKLLFLVATKQEKASYHFIPYRFGCYSFQANADLNTLTKYNIVTKTDTYWQKANDINYFAELKPKDRSAILYVKNQFGKLSRNELIAYTYKKYPYYAIYSSITPDLLTSEEIEKIEQQKQSKQDTILFTIGYEGISIEQYINKLIQNNIKVLCDIRKNPLSMKYGFSKNQLKHACNSIGIKYMHFPELGIESDKRQQLIIQSDYDKLFLSYKANILKNEIEKQNEILKLNKNYKRIALTCFEADINKCHRKHLAESISGLKGFSYELKHI